MSGVGRENNMKKYKTIMLLNQEIHLGLKKAQNGTSDLTVVTICDMNISLHVLYMQ